MAAELRDVLSAEVPNVEFDDLIIQHLQKLQESSESDDEVAESWSQFFIDNGSACDDAAARSLCLRILNRLKGGVSATTVSETSTQSCVEGLSEWLARLKIEKYEAKCLDWCQKNHISDVNGILNQWNQFSDDVGLKRLEKARVQTDSEKQVRPMLRGRPTFGNPPYSIMQKLGGGATAEVHKCVRVENGILREFAVKVVDLRPYRMQHNFDEIVGKLKREISILYALQHDNVVSLFETVDDSAVNNKLYLVMELVEGGDLFTFICDHGCQTEDNAARIFLQLVYALRYVHSRGVVHRDLKPENVLVDSTSKNGVRVKITDFGHSKLLDDGHSIPLTKVGTPQYWPPEILDDKVRQKGYNEKVDLWSLGVLLFVMLTGQYPFEADDKMMSQKIAKGVFCFREGRTPSPEAQDLIKKLIQPDPAVRLSLDQCLSHSWLQSRSGIASPKPVTGPGIEMHEETITLPHDPKDAKAFKSALTVFTTKTRFAARTAGKQQLVVTWQTPGLSGQALETSLVRARVELAVLLSEHFSGFSLPPREGIAEPGALSSGYPTLQQNFTTSTRPAVGAPLAPVKEERGPQASYKKVKLRVHPEHGAGLNLQAVAGGMRIREVEEVPGQPGLLAHDLIVEVSGVRLGPTAEEAERQFGEHFKDGAWMKISRST